MNRYGWFHAQTARHGLYGMVLLALVFESCICPTDAAIIVSGDSNITDPLVGAQGAPIDPGNRQFFTNSLQGGSSVLVSESWGGGAWKPENSINTFYNSLPGVTSNVLSGPVTGSQLAGVDLYVSPLPGYAFIASEIAALGNFLAGGGSVFFLSEHGAAWPGHSLIINDALSSLGSTILLSPNTAFDGGSFHSATGPQIAADPFTVGVATLTYTAFAEVNGGTHLFFGTQGRPFVAYETTTIPAPGAIVLGVLGAGVVGWLRRRKTL